ncbi:MAG: SelT/SelW/SelH family protein [Planctomycetota bacterium]|nr:MAG: SelT/SelW/SelH family protein [Planctomycetota bacterium]
MTAKLLSALKKKISSLELQPSDGGCFELTVNGKLVYSKLKEGKFPDEAWALKAVSELA